MIITMMMMIMMMMMIIMMIVIIIIVQWPTAILFPFFSIGPFQTCSNDGARLCYDC